MQFEPKRELMNSNEGGIAVACICKEDACAGWCKGKCGAA